MQPLPRIRQRQREDESRMKLVGMVGCNHITTNHVLDAFPAQEVAFDLS